MFLDVFKNDTWDLLFHCLLGRLLSGTDLYVQHPQSTPSHLNDI